jgi:hypothetical protein
VTVANVALRNADARSEIHDARCPVRGDDVAYAWAGQKGW